MMRIFRFLSFWLMAGFVAACGSPLDAPSGEIPPPDGPVQSVTGPFIVSNPVAPEAGSGQGSATVERLVYVSVPPDSLSGIEVIRIKVLRTGSVVDVAVVNGGFDPVPIPGVTGDTLRLAIREPAGQSTAWFKVIPPPKPPIIVRTEPRRNKRDVVLNARLQVVFSEPIDPVSITARSFDLRTGGQSVPGEHRIDPATSTLIEFIPTATLLPATDYQLVLGTGIRDREGSSLETEIPISFTTVDSVGTPPPQGVAPFLLSNTAYLGEPRGPADFAFLSLPRGALSHLADAYGVEVRLRNGQGSVQGTLVDGGLDPIPVRGARTGDSIVVRLLRTGNGPRDWGIAQVPASTLPTLIRTQPLPEELLVPLDRPIQAVFSEPMGDAALAPGQITLRAGATLVPGELRFVDPEHTTIQFVPDQDLTPATRYELVIAGGVPDAQGAGLPGLALASFTTTPTLTPAPAGGQLAFVRDDAIHLVGSDGTGLVQLTHPTEGLRDRSPAWSPDGTRLAFTRIGAGLPNEVPDIYLVNADGTGEVRLTAGLDPAWSPNGHSIAFTSLQNGSVGISVIEANGASQRVLLDWPGYDAEPAWSPDDSTLTFTSDWRAYDFVYELYKVNADGTNPRLFVAGGWPWPDIRYLYHSAWSPDGRLIAVTLCVPGFFECYPRSEIGIVDQGGVVRVLAAAQGGGPLTWSPDGRMIAYASIRCSTCSPSIRFVLVDGSGQGVIIDNGHSPAWRPLQAP